MKTIDPITRRQALKLMGVSVASLSLSPLTVLGQNNRSLLKPIPGADEKIPVIGIGTWRTFNVGNDRQLRLDRTEVLKAFFDEGGGMVDCSPMYGSAREVLGFALERIGVPDTMFSAEKVWTRDGGKTREQIAESEELWGVQPFDLMQVHNLVAAEAHLETLQEMKEAGEIRYVGITTSHGRRHEDFAQLMERGGIDFVQLTYNITHREVEDRLLPLAQEKGIAVIANRPYDGGSLIRDLKANHEVPRWAADEFDCENWADFLLKFIVSHPAVTCAIPATTRVDHLRENMGAGRGALPNAETRERMIRHIESL
ncbi:MAG: aldo/keto reductase [Opitutales bacterium]|nr:aldo/keto reductase [Opitutales bacterium]MCH8540650.1 aldo/keto reductase [Opitutales bacterium]